jgi:PAS domain S-box-containing protein
VAVDDMSSPGRDNPAAARLGDAWQRLVHRLEPRPDASAGMADSEVPGSAARRRLAAAAGGVGVWEFDFATRTMTWSPEQYGLHGLDPAGGPPTFDQWLDLVEPEDRAMIHDAEVAIQAPGAGSMRLEFCIRRHSDGARRWLAGLSRLVTDDAGRPSRMIGINLDITERRQAEDDLRRATALLTAIGNGSPDPIYAKDSEGRFVFANAAVLAVIGKTADEVIGRTDAELHHDPAQAAAVMANDRRIVETGRIEVVEETFDAAGLGTRVFRSAKAPLRLEDGTIAGVVAVSSDITNVKEAEAALRESEERFRATFEQAGVGMALATPEGAWFQVNDRLCAMLGYARAELLTMSFRDITHPDDIPANTESVRRLLAGEAATFTMEKRYRHKDGSYVWGTLTSSLVRDRTGAPRHFVAQIEDISQRKLAEDNQRDSEARFRKLFEGAPLPNYLIDPADASVVDGNEAAATMLGHARDALRGMRLADIDATTGDVERVARHRMLAGETVQFETRHRTRSGEIRDVLVAAVPFDLAGRRLAHATVVDITERKRAEAALRRLTEDLESRVREEIGAREAAQARAAQAERMQALGQLAGGIAHDFNNVLQALAGATALIERRPGDAAGVHRLARIAIEAADRGASITRRLLAFGRRGDLRAEALDAAALLGGLREILRHTLGAAVDVQVRLQAGLPRLLADKGQLETALVNLATNARDAMPAGGRLVLAAEAEILSPEAPPPAAGLAPGRYVRLTVTDTGMGMDAAILARASEPFFTTKDIGVGTGLGLPMAKGFAEQSGGALRIESRPGDGTTVTLWLPEAAAGPHQADAAPEASAGPATARSGTPARVLLVDDEQLVRDIIAEHLEDAGFTVMSAANGTEALALLGAGEAVDALVTDLSMPGMDGIAVIRAAQMCRPGLPAVLLTGYDGDGATAATGARVAGTFSLLRKPVRGRDLIDRILTLLEGRPRPEGPPPQEAPPLPEAPLPTETRRIAP